MVEDSGNLAEHCSDPLGTLGHLDIEQLLNSERVDLLVGHHRNVVQTIKVWQGLEVGLVLDQLLSTTMEQTDVGVCTNDFLAIEFEN